jgi:mannosyltransferase
LAAPAAAAAVAPRPARSDAGSAPTGGGPSRAAQLVEIGAVALATALTLALCLYDIGSRSLWLDEANRVVVAQQRGIAFWSGIAGDGGNQTVYYSLLRAVTTVFGSSPVVVRVPSAIAAAATVPFAAAIVHRLFDARAAVAGAFLVGVSLPLVYWGQDVDGYALGVLMATVSCWAFVRLLEDRSSRAAVVYAAVTVLMLYTLMLTAFVLAGQAISLVFRRRGETPWRRLLYAGGAVALLAIPLAVMAKLHGTADISWLSPPTKALEHDAVHALASAGNAPEYPHHVGTSELLFYLTLAVWAGGLLLLGWRLARRGASGSAFAPAFLICWFVIPVALDYGVSVTYQPVFITRYILYSLPAASLLVGVVLTRLRPAVPAALGGAAVVALLVLRFMQIPSSYGVPLEDWKSPTNFVLDQTRPGDCVAFYVDDGRMPFEYYLRQGPTRKLLPTPVLPALPWTDNPIEVEVNTPIAPSALPGVVAECSRLFLVASHDGFTNGSPNQRVTYADYHRMLGELAADYPSSKQTVFGSVSVWTYSGAGG